MLVHFAMSGNDKKGLIRGGTVVRSKYRFLPVYSFLEYLTDGLPLDYENGKRLHVVLGKLATHALYGALTVGYIGGVACTQELNPLEMFSSSRQNNSEFSSVDPVVRYSGHYVPLVSTKDGGKSI